MTPGVAQGAGAAWLVLLAAGAAMVLAAVVAQAVLYAALRRVARSNAIARELVRSTSSPARLALALIAIQFAAAWTPPAFAHGAALRAGIALLLVVALTWLAIRAVGGIAQAVMALHPIDTGDNLDARRVQTQTRILGRVATFFIVLVGVAFALTIFPGARQVGTSLLASAGLAGLVAGLAARPVLGNLIAGLQIALTQPVRLDDVVVIEGEWGRIEEIASTFVAVRLWDDRRLVVPLQWLIEHPFQNWTRREAALLGSVLLWLDYRAPLEALRDELARVCRAAPEWDHRVASIQVVETSEHAMQVRALVSAADSSRTWDLRCRVREALIEFVQRDYPDALRH